MRHIICVKGGMTVIDSQMKRGLLDICVLAALCRGESYGYQIIKDLHAVIGLSESTLYPILRRLESSGQVEEYSIAHNGRLRKFYRITSSGKAQIRSFMQSWPEISAIYEYIKGAESNAEV